MHFRHTVDPTPLKLITTMNYGNYQDMPEYYGIDLHRAPPTHYAPYARPPMPPVKYEPIVPNENDSKSPTEELPSLALESPI